MKGILADLNIQGHVEYLVRRMQAEPWKPFWEHLLLGYYSFADVGLERSAPDSVVWQTCQKLELLLITENRNQDGPDSLEETIRTQSTSRSWPVFTIANVQRLRKHRKYADEVIDSLFVYLLQGDKIRGAGRLYLP